MCSSALVCLYEYILYIFHVQSEMAIIIEVNLIIITDLY